MFSWLVSLSPDWLGLLRTLPFFYTSPTPMPDQLGPALLRGSLLTITFKTSLPDHLHSSTRPLYR